MIFDRLAEIVAERGVVTRTEPESLSVGAETGASSTEAEAWNHRIYAQHYGGLELTKAIRG